MSDTKNIFLQLDKPLKFRFSRIQEMESFLIDEFNDREK